MADATLALNPVTPIWGGVQVSTAAPFPVQLFTSAIQGWSYVNVVGATGGTGTTTIVKASAGTFHGIAINSISTLGTWSMIDAAATAATPIIAAGSLGTVTSLFYDAATTAGIVFTTVTTSTATSLPNVTITYK